MNKSKEGDYDIVRKKILETLCVSSVTFLIALFFIYLSSLYDNGKNKIEEILIIFASILVNIASFIFNRRGKILTSGLLISTLLYGCILYGSLHWGVELPTVLILLFILVIITGTLIDYKTGLIVLLGLSVHMEIFYYFEKNNIIITDNSWKKYYFDADDMFKYSIILIFALIFSWLSNKHLEKAFKKAEIAELKLREETSNIEKRVTERTEEIKNLQLDKINSMYRLVEFGRISSGLFHDIINPITDISLNLQLLNTEEVSKTLQYLIPSIKKMEKIIHQSKKHIRITDGVEKFDINNEILSTIEMLSSKSRQKSIKILMSKKSINETIYGSEALFSHVITNIISNAIDSFEQQPMRINKIIKIITTKKINYIQIKITDNGCGIEDVILKNIFEPFYTTKKDSGFGIGLSATKHIIEKYFNGIIKVKSMPEKGTSFIITIPINAHSFTTHPIRDTLPTGLGLINPETVI